MGFIEAVKDGFKRFLDFQGVSSRPAYWYFTLFVIIVSLIITCLEAFKIPTSTVLAIIINLALILPGLALSIRRLHDSGKSGWWLLISFVPLIGAIILLYFYVQPTKTVGNPYRQD